jgi:transposase
MRFEQRGVLLIWDGLPAHGSRRLSAWVASQRQWLAVEPLPAYAPELNPIERVWGNLKSTELANLCSDKITQLPTLRKTAPAQCLRIYRHADSNAQT